MSLPRKRLSPGVPIHITRDGGPACGSKTEGGLSPYFGFADCRDCAELLRVAISNGTATLVDPQSHLPGRAGIALVLWATAPPPRSLGD